MKKAIPKPSITTVFESYGARVLGADRGGWQKATCALNSHDDHSPSASVNETECKWRCWGCNESGDALDLVMANEGCDFRAALDILTERYGDEGRAEQTDDGLRRGVVKRKPGGGFKPPWTRL